MKVSVTYLCQLYATYPAKSSDLSLSSTSNVMIYSDRILTSVYIDNGTRLSNPTNLFTNNINSWIPALKLYTNNNQSFLWFNSSNSTILTNIPQIPVNQTKSHWYSVLISQWNQNLYRPNQVAIAFIINRTRIIDFLVFNSSQSNIISWFSISRLISNQYWTISEYSSVPYAHTQVTAIYTDSDCIRSFNCNFKASTNGYSEAFDGYKDLCTNAVQNISTVSIPSIYYNPTTNANSQSLSGFKIADSLMIFVR